MTTSRVHIVPSLVPITSQPDRRPGGSCVHLNDKVPEKTKDCSTPLQGATDCSESGQWISACVTPVAALTIPRRYGYACPSSTQHTLWYLARRIAEAREPARDSLNQVCEARAKYRTMLLGLRPDNTQHGLARYSPGRMPRMSRTGQKGFRQAGQAFIKE